MKGTFNHGDQLIERRLFFHDHQLSYLHVILVHYAVKIVSYEIYDHEILSVFFRCRKNCRGLRKCDW